MAIKRYKRTDFENLIRFIKFRVLHVNDSPKRIARAVSLGLFIAWTPILGVHMILALFFSIIAKANKIVALATVWVSNPFTYLPMWSFGYMFGRMLLKIFTCTNKNQPEDMAEQATTFDLSDFFSRFFELSLWKELAAALWAKGPELWLGCLTLGVISAIVGYFLTYHLIIRSRKRNPHRRFRKHL